MIIKKFLESLDFKKTQSKSFLDKPKLVKHKFSRHLWYSLAKVKDQERFVLGIPVESGQSTTTELYEISRAEFEDFSEDMSRGSALAERCRERKTEEHRLVYSFLLRGLFKNERMPILEKYEVDDPLNPDADIIEHEDD